MMDKVVLEKLANTKAAREVQTLQRLFSMLQVDPDRATYGWSTVSKANEQGGIEILMVSDDLFRAQDIATRQKYVKLVENVKANGGEVQIFSSLHVSGARTFEQG